MGRRESVASSVNTPMAARPPLRILLLACALAGVASAADGDGFLPVESRIVTLAVLPEAPDAAAPAGVVRLSTQGVPTTLYRDRLFLLSERPQAPVADWALPPGTEPVRDYCWLDDTGTLALLRETTVDFVRAGRTIRSVATPARGMRLARADAGHCYLYGGEGEEWARTVLVLGVDGALRPLARLPEAVTAVAGNGANTFVAAGPVVHFLGTGAEPRPVFSETAVIEELAYAPPVGVFYRTSAGIGCLHGPAAGSLFLRQPTRSLDVRDGRLLVLTADRAVLLIAPIARIPSLLDEVRTLVPGRRP